MTSRTTYQLGNSADPSRELERLRLQAGIVASAELDCFGVFGAPEAGNVLDVGCGPGFFSRIVAERWPELRIIGADLNPSALHVAGTWQSVVRADSRTLPFVDNCFDLVFARVMLKHVPQPERAVAEMVRVARPGGCVIVEEVDDASILLYPEPPGFRELLELRHSAVRRHGANPNIARMLPSLLKRTGMQEIALQILPVSSLQIGASAFAQIILSGLTTAIDAGLIRGSACDHWDIKVTDWISNPDSFGCFSAFFVGGTK